jgi:hypothetical protein
MLPAVSLYRDDIEELTAIITAATRSVSVSDGSYVFDSLEELITQRGTRPKTLILTGGGHSVVIKIRRLSGFGCTIYSSGSDETDVAFFKAREILKGKRTLLSRLFVPKFWVVALFASMVVGFLSTHMAMPGRLAVDRVSSYFFFFSMAMTGASFFVASGFMSGVNLARRHEATTFWSRNGEKLIIGLVSAILGIFAKSLFDFFMSWRTR